MKKSLWVLALLCSLSSPVLAANADPTAGPYTTNNGSTVEKNVFGWDDTPFAFIQFNSDDLNLNRDLDLDFRFKHEGTGNVYWAGQTNDLTGSTGLLNYWQSLSNWSSVKETGTWELKTFWHNPGAANGNQSYNFTVTPEPASMALFGLGAGLLGLTRLRRKKA